MSNSDIDTILSQLLYDAAIYRIMEKEAINSPNTSNKSEDESSSSASDVHTDDEEMQNIQSSAAELKLGQLLDLVYDPKVNISDHDDDDELVIYQQYDSDDDGELEEASSCSDQRLGRQVSEWCRCSNCSTMNSEQECNCCQESDLVMTVVENGACITELQAFKDFAENKGVLELLAFSASNKRLARDKARRATFSMRG